MLVVALLAATGPEGVCAIFFLLLIVLPATRIGRRIAAKKERTKRDEVVIAFVCIVVLLAVLGVALLLWLDRELADWNRAFDA